MIQYDPLLVFKMNCGSFCKICDKKYCTGKMATRMCSKMKPKRPVRSEDNKGNVKSSDDCDTSILTKPLITNINNMQKILKLYQDTTDEIRGYLTYECDILYECRVCRSIFRSISNFIMHKRNFCQEKYCHVTYSKLQKNDEDFLDIIQEDVCDEYSKIESKDQKKNLDSIISNLTQKKQLDVEVESLFSGELEENNSDPNSNRKLDLENVDGSNCSVFQTLQTQGFSRSKTEKMKQEVMEMYNMSKGQSVVLGPSGKVINQKPVSGLKPVENNENALVCPKCNINFATRKTLFSHIKYKHEKSRFVYPCPECSDTFSTIWSVYRHLYNIHRKTLTEVRKMRPLIQAKAFRREETEANKSNKEDKNESMNDQQKIDEENQAWMDNFESDNDIQMCGGCGRRFERKAALNSHSQTCQKRIAARNLINMNKQKRIAALEDKTIEKKNPAKILKLETEVDKKIVDKQKFNVAKKRKIGIQIRYDYNKPVEKNVPSPAVSNTYEDEVKRKSVQNYNELAHQLTEKRVADNLNAQSGSEVLCSLKNKVISDFNLEESEVVSIPSSNSSPNKEEQDPLSLKDLQSDSDSEIEEILGPIDHSIFGSQTQLFDYKDTENDQYQLTNINENTLKLIKLINSDLVVETSKPTLDTKMASHINIKKLQCVSCDVKFSNMSKLRHHMASHFNWTRFRCDVCAFRAYDKIDVFEHIKREHNIELFEKIEAVILQIPDWEIVELSSAEFLPNVNEISSAVVIIDEKKDDVNVVKSIKKQKQKNSKIIKKKTKDTSIKEQYSLSDNNSDEENSQNCSSLPDLMTAGEKDLKKMVYEVIFGQDAMVPTKTSNSNSNSSSIEEKLIVQTQDKKRSVDQSNVGGEGFDPVTPFHSNNDSKPQSDDDDIYIIENEELVAV